MARLLALAAAAVAAVALPGSTLAEGRDFVEARWGAIAAALWRDGNGTAQVASGASWNQPSEREAVDVALASCRKRGGQGCRIIGSTFTGCGYVAIGGSRTSRRYGTGESPAAALRECRKGGFTCQTPVGGCSK